ncbi:MAG TPA: hypothetical protein VF053_16000 [Streptosporangiales bacterium]
MIWHDRRGDIWLTAAGPLHASPDAAVRDAPNVLAGGLYPGAPAPAAIRLQAATRVGNRWHRRRARPSSHHRKPLRPAGREIPYDVARYLALDALSALGSLAGYSIAGPAGMLAGFFATSVARGVVSGTIGVIRARATRRWEMRQERRHLASFHKDREQDVRLADYDDRLTDVETALARLGRHVGIPVPDPSAAHSEAAQRLDEHVNAARQRRPTQPGLGAGRQAREQHPRATGSPTHLR